MSAQQSTDRTQKLRRRARDCARVFALLAIAACSAGDDSGARAGAATANAGSQAGAAGVSGAAGTGPAGAPGTSSGAQAGAPAIGGSGGNSAAAGAGAGEGAAGAAGTPALDAGMPDAGGAAGTGAPAMTCPEAPAGASAQAVTALAVVNEARVAAGAGCAAMIAEINAAAQNHCDYYAANTGTCTANPHNEVEGCTGFTGEGPGDRMQAAGYTGRGASEVMAFANDPERAIAQWINSVWHRLPILDPWTTHIGYGNAERCDTIDFGRGTPAPEDTVVFYPYAGQVDVPVSFDGSREGPMPPAPSTGWPSGSPINVYARDIRVTERVLTVDGDDTPIEHVFLTSADSGFLRNGVMLYSNLEFAEHTTYRVKIAGSYVGGPLELEWTFTTGAAPTRRR